MSFLTSAMPCLLVCICIMHATAAEGAAAKPQLRKTAPAAFAVEEFEGRAFQLRGPKGYQPTKEYPLLIWLHGAGNNGTDTQKALAAAPETFKEDALQNRYPTFVYVPQCPDGASWGSPAALTMLTGTIRHLSQVYPIDPRRIYLAGFSMGGSGSYHVAQAWFEASGAPFGAVMRCAGQSEYPAETHAILARSPVWIHIGLQDTPQRVALARDSYQKLRQNHYPDAAEADRNQTVEAIKITENGRVFTGTMYSLSKAGSVVARLSEYDTEGHSVPEFAFKQPATFDWLFAQGLPLKPVKAKAKKR